jgi:hypothetical protein
MDRRQFVTQSVAHSVAALAVGRTALASSYSRTQRPSCNYRIAYNDDGHTLQHSSGLDDLLKKGVDCFIGTQVDALFWSIGHSDIYLFDTKTGEMFGQHVNQFDNAWEYRLHKGLQSVLNDRRDYIQAMADRAREIGIHFFASFRMNDCHDSPGGWNSRDQYSQFKKAHPELLLGESVHPAFATGFDFSYPESRQNKFQVIEEVVHAYDVDGIELDFLRHPAFFKPDEAFGHRHLITGLVQRVRALLDEVGASRGKPIRLAVRVPFTFELAHKLGLDAPAWIEEGLADVVTAGTPRGHELDLSMSEYAEATRGKPLTLLGQIGLYHPPEQTRATALNYWKQGVHGIYLFNWYAPLRNRATWRKSLVEIGDPSLLNYRNKQYVIDKQIGSMWTRSHPKAQLPLEIRPVGSEGATAIKFHIGDDVQAAATAGHFARCKLVTRFEDTLEDDDLQIKLNGVVLSLDQGETEHRPTLFSKEDWFHLPFKAPLLKTGPNQLEFILRARNRQVAAPLTLADMSIWIDYETET